MTAPTVPTAPLPTAVQIAIDYLDRRMLSGAPDSHWKTVKEHLLTMQRERDEVTGKCAAFEEATRVLMMANDTLRDQLAASERMCAELREQLTDAKQSEYVQSTRAHAERDRRIAAERTVEGLREPFYKLSMAMGNPCLHGENDETLESALVKFAIQRMSELRAELEAAELVVEGWNVSLNEARTTLTMHKQCHTIIDWIETRAKIARLEGEGGK